MKKYFKQITQVSVRISVHNLVGRTLSFAIYGAVDLLIRNAVVISVRNKVGASVQRTLNIDLESVTDEFVHAKKIQTNK